LLSVASPGLRYRAMVAAEARPQMAAYILLLLLASYVALWCACVCRAGCFFRQRR
jgi:hypothetical protein